MFGNLRARSRRSIRHHASINLELHLVRQGIFERAADFFFEGIGLVRFFVLYLLAAATVILITYFPISIHILDKTQRALSPFFCAGCIESVIDEINRSFLTAQAALAGIIFPITVALISVLFQQPGQAFSARAQAYYQESEVLRIAGSSLALIIILVVQQFQVFPVLFREILLGSNSESILFVRAGLMSIHGIWLILNTFFIWRFLMISFAFIHSDGRRAALRRYMARKLIPHTLEGLHARDYLRDSSITPNGGPTIIYGGMSDYGGIGDDIGVAEVEKHKDGTHILYDVRFYLIKWVVSRWIDRSESMQSSSSGESGFAGLSPNDPMLIFPHEIGDRSSGSVCLCRRYEGSSLSILEKKLIKYSFIFEEMAE